jgi:hypothetical protein
LEWLLFWIYINQSIVTDVKWSNYWTYMCEFFTFLSENNQESVHTHTNYVCTYINTHIYIHINTQFELNVIICSTNKLQCVASVFLTRGKLAFLGLFQVVFTLSLCSHLVFVKFMCTLKHFMYTGTQHKHINTQHKLSHYIFHGCNKPCFE